MTSNINPDSRMKLRSLRAAVAIASGRMVVHYHARMVCLFGGAVPLALALDLTDCVATDLVDVWLAHVRASDQREAAALGMQKNTDRP